MSRQEKGQGPQQIFKRLPRRRNFSCRSSHPEKYILEGETREIGQVVTAKSAHCNTTILTFKFTEVPQENFSHKMMSPSRIDLGRRRNASRDMHATIRPLASNLNLASIRVASCEVRKLESEICNRRSRKKVEVEEGQEGQEGCGLEVQGVGSIRGTNESGGPRASTSGTRMRLTTGSFRVKSHQGQLGSHSVELVQLLRRPTFKKDHFVFSLTEKPDSPDTRMEAFRDFLWKINYTNGLFTIAPSACTYKAFIGKGNNSIMVRGILRRRAWWSIVEDPAEANFVWMQLKNNSYFESQPIRKAELTLKDVYSEGALVAEEIEGVEDGYARIFNAIDLKNWRSHCRRNPRTEQKVCSTTYMKRVGLLSKKRLLKVDNPCLLRMQNHLSHNYHIGNKKALFHFLTSYYTHANKPIEQTLPLTFHLAKGAEDPRYGDFLQAYGQLQERRKIEKDLRNIWIMKPGQSSNRGNGITVCFSLEDIQTRLKGRQRNRDGSLRTFILQKYIERPLLFQGRKFDLRHYMLVTCVGGTLRGYWYLHGYVRTSSSHYSLRNSKDLMVHLTNDAVQKHCDSYGKFEPGNKLSYEELEKYISKQSRKDGIGRTISFQGEILPRMREIALDALRATYHLLDPLRRHHNFELLGLDFMIDDAYRPLLIEVNTNPCLELSCPLLEAIIPPLIENTLRLCVDPLFPPPEGVSVGKKGFCADQCLETNNFTLFFDELIDGPPLRLLFQEQQGNVELGSMEEEEEFQNDGAQNWEQRAQ